MRQGRHPGIVLRIILLDEGTLSKRLVARDASRELLGLPLRPPRLPVCLEAAHEILRAITVQLVAQTEGVLLKLAAPALDQPEPFGTVSPVPFSVEQVSPRLGKHDQVVIVPQVA